MKKILFVLFFVFLSIGNYSQDKKHFSIWGNVGGGLSYLKYSDGYGGFSVNYGLSSRFDKWIISAKYRNENEFSFQTPNEKFNSVCLLFGLSNKLLKENRVVELNINMLSGISYIEIVERDNLLRTGTFGDYYDLHKYSTLGIPIELELEFRFSHYVGFSFSMFSNINKSKNVLGTNVNFILGYF